MACTIFLVLLFTYCTNAHFMPNFDFKIANEGLVDPPPEIVTDSFGYSLDINRIPTVPWVPVPELIRREGYVSESHYVTTSDGYTLNVHRIPYGKNGQSNGKAVLLQHGLFGASSDWLLLGPGTSLAYILADEGYDVWLGNARGNTYSKNHTTLSPDSKDFWRFSWHEIGIIDTPTMIDYILEKTGQSDLFYIGHSQGTTGFYVMASERPEYNLKIKAHISLAPIAFMEHIFSPLFRMMASGSLPPEVLLQMYNQYEFMPSSDFLDMMTIDECLEGVGKVLCKNNFFAMDGFSPKQMNVSVIPLLLAHSPAGASLKQVVHYVQEIISAKFRQFDYGSKKNYNKYGSLSPPDYELSRITAPMHLLYGSNDWLAADIDVKKLYSMLNSGRELYNIPLKTWGHSDFLYGYGARDLVYNKISDILSLY